MPQREAHNPFKAQRRACHVNKVFWWCSGKGFEVEDDRSVAVLPLLIASTESWPLDSRLAS